MPSLGQGPGGGSVGRNLGHSLVSTLSQTGAWNERGFEVPGLRTSVPHWDFLGLLIPAVGASMTSWSCSWASVKPEGPMNAEHLASWGAVDVR